MLNNINKKSLTLMVVLGIGLMSAGCNSKEAPKPNATNEIGQCRVANELAPQWVCGYHDDKDTLSSVGYARISKIGRGFTNKEAVADARSALAQQIQTEVKDKIEVFMRSTGLQDSEVADKVTTQVTKQVAKVTLNGSRQINYWESANDNSMYVLVSIDKNSLNKNVKKSVLSSFKNDDALWQQFQSKNAMESLEKEFPTQK